jgi:hypothetical protein
VALLFFKAYFYNTHQVLVGLPQGVGGIAIVLYFVLYYFNNTVKVMAGQARGRYPGLSKG